MQPYRLSSMQTVEYRNTEGYIIDPQMKPRFDRKMDEENMRGSWLRCAAKYALCPETGSLKWLGHCEDCELFGGHIKHVGISCNSTKEIKEIKENLIYNREIYGSREYKEIKARKNCRAIK